MQTLQYVTYRAQQYNCNSFLWPYLLYYLAQWHPTLSACPLSIDATQMILPTHKTTLLTNPWALNGFCWIVHGAIFTCDPNNRLLVCWNCICNANGWLSMGPVLKTPIRQWFTNQVCHYLDIEVINQFFIIFSLINNHLLDISLPLAAIPALNIHYSHSQHGSL